MGQYFLFELKNKRKAIIGWGVGMLAFALLYVGLYPSFYEQVTDFQELLDLPIYQAMGISDMTTFGGWISSTVLNFLPIIVGVYALTAGTGTLAGEEEKGTLENIATLPLARWQIVTAKFLAIILALLGVLVLTGLGTLAITAWVVTQVDMTVSYQGIFGAIMAAFPLLTFLTALSVWLSAFLPTRAAAGAVATVVLIASYLVNNLFGQIEILSDYRFLSPFYYYDASQTAISEGLAMGDALTLLALAAVFFVLALWSFERRNLQTHTWFWQRPRLPEA